jgi:tetratricopeptide (TPR) repeat protein
MTAAPTASPPLSPWLVVTGGMLAALLLVLAQNLGARPLTEMLLHAPGIDKALHFGQSLALFVLFYVALGRTRLRARLPVALAMALAAACVDELQQRFAGGRSIEFADIGAGAAGVVFGLGVQMRRHRPLVALLAVVAGLGFGVGVTYDSYLRTRDYNAGLLAERAGRKGDALQAYLRAVDSGVRHPEVFNAAAWALAESTPGDPARAVSFAEESLAMRPGDPDTLDTYGWALYRAGRARDAVSPLEAALAAKPDIYCIHYHLAMVYQAIGRADDAIRHFHLQVERQPKTFEAAQAAEQLSRLNRSSKTAE